MSKKEILRSVYEENKRINEKRFGGQGASARSVAAGIGGLGVLAVLVVVAFMALSADENVVQQGPATGNGPVMRMGVPVQPDTTSNDAVPAGPSLDVLAASDVPLASLFDLGIHTIVVDAGHGGVDSGARGREGLFEKDVTLDVAQRLKRRLDQHESYSVLMTRTSDSTLTLRDRVEFANGNDADLFISIHVNYFPSDSVYALETYYFGGQSDDAALRLAERENRNSDYSVAEFNRMMSRVSDQVKGEESRRLARSVQRSMIRHTRAINGDVQNWGTKSGPFVVLVGTDAPGILAEIGVISNGDEESRLVTPEYREQLALFIEEGIINYLKQMSPEAEAQ